MPPKKTMSEEEWHEMVQKMDDDLDLFIQEKIKANINKKPESYDFEKIMEDMDTNPAFMTKFDPTKPISSSMEALIQLKYEECETATEKAIAYKEDGNHNFKIGKYRWAIDNYAVAIGCKCDDALVNAQCYTNRAAAHFRLGNFTTAFKDALFARKFVPGHLKAIIRGAHCCMKTKRYDLALTWIDEGLLEDSAHAELLKMKNEAEKEKKIQDRDKRKEKVKLLKEGQKRQTLLNAIKERGITLKGVDGSDYNKDEVIGEEWETLFGVGANTEAANARVFLDDYGTLHWPVLFLYPEHGQTDMISQANENTRIMDFMEQIFGAEVPAPGWDQEGRYKPEHLEVYFEDSEREALYKVDKEAPLKAILNHERYRVVGGLPSLIVLVKDADFTLQFLKKYSVK